MILILNLILNNYEIGSWSNFRPLCIQILKFADTNKQAKVWDFSGGYTHQLHFLILDNFNIESVLIVKFHSCAKLERGMKGRTDIPHLYAATT